jgi:hypothetical protein
MGEADRTSASTKIIEHALPTIRLSQTDGWLQPALDDSRNP